MSDERGVLSRHSILVGLALSMIAITTIGVGGIAASGIVAERVQGSGSAINVAGSLRKQSHRMGSQVLADVMNGATSHGPLLVAMTQFEASLADPSLQTALRRQPDSDFAATYQIVERTWKTRLKPMLAADALPGPNLLPVVHHNELLAVIDSFVDDINTMVAQLEADTEARISQLRAILGVALVLIVIVLLTAMLWVRKRVLAPLDALLDNATRISRGDFETRNHLSSQDELGRLGQAFNTMATDLGKLYHGLEQRVAEKTAALSRSNQSLELLYHSIARLHHAPVAPETYQAMLGEIERLFGLSGSMACLLPKHEGGSQILASSLPVCADNSADGCARCAHAHASGEHWHYVRECDLDVLVVPLRDNEGLYGMLRLALPAGRRLEDWQTQLLEALSRHIGIALGISRRTEQERLLALQEERSVIARELHDSIAQSLSYMKIQASLLQPVLADPRQRQQAETILRDLREGISSAYRQLRELLVTFRLKMHGDFIDLLRRTVHEMTERGGVPIQLETHLEGCHLSPNQEIHSLQIIREALYNVVRHAEASHILVKVLHAEGEVRVSVEDDGVGLPPATATPAHHYGLNIMRERAAGLRGHLEIGNRPGGGTGVYLCFAVEREQAALGVPMAVGTLSEQAPRPISAPDPVPLAP